MHVVVAAAILTYSTIMTLRFWNFLMNHLEIYLGQPKYDLTSRYHNRCTVTEIFRLNVDKMI